MKRASISEAKNRLSALLDRVRNGDSILIEDRGVPVARLEPVTSTRGSQGRLARLERHGALRRERTALDPSLLRERPPRAKDGATASAVLIEERRTDR